VNFAASRWFFQDFAPSAAAPSVFDESFTTPELDRARRRPVTDGDRDSH
jgi:hypothetical protein